MPVCLVLDFRTADLRARERFHLGEEHATRLYDEPRAGAVREVALVSTCNRVELYGAAAECGRDAAGRAVAELALRWAGDGERARALLSAATVHTGHHAARHLLRVSAGLESQVLGDAQVLGQVRRAFRGAAEAGAAGPVLHRLFETALRAGKRVAADTVLVGAPRTVGSEAAAVAGRRLGPLAGRRCVVAGCGKTGEQAARRLVKEGAGEIVLVNRTPARAERLAAEVRGRAAPWKALHREAARADAVLVATGAEEPVLRAASLARARGGAAAPLLVLDLGVPRNVEPRCGALPGLTLLDLDALRVPLAAAEDGRRGAVPAAEAIVEEELARFAAWHREAAARLAVLPLREALEEACRREVAFAAGEEAAAAAAGRIVSRVLAGPMSALRAAGERGEPLDGTTSLLRGLFSGAPGAPAALPSVRPEPVRVSVSRPSLPVPDPGGPMNDLFLRACRREPVERPPVWMMRQAGRYMPEYRAVRARSDFLTMVRTPELVAEVTLQPVELLGVDAAILFSDILTLPQAMGMELLMDEGVGPQFPQPLRTRADFDRLRDVSPEEGLPYVLEAVRLVRRELGGRVPLLGFAGAPWTLASYMIEGGTSKTFAHAKRLLNEDPFRAHALLARLANAVGYFLHAQVGAGAQAVQIFESWAGALGPDDFRTFCLPYLAQAVRIAKGAGAPVIVYALGAGWALEEIAAETGADVVGIDWQTSAADARRRLAPYEVALQGNFEPTWLFSPPEVVRQKTLRMLEDFGPDGYIANLGHGILPQTPVENVKVFLETIQSWEGHATLRLDEAAAHHRRRPVAIPIQPAVSVRAEAAG